MPCYFKYLFINKSIVIKGNTVFKLAVVGTFIDYLGAALYLMAGAREGTFYKNINY
jgi:hypothetical protein